MAKYVEAHTLPPAQRELRVGAYVYGEPPDWTVPDDALVCTDPAYSDDPQRPSIVLTRDGLELEVWTADGQLTANSAGVAIRVHERDDRTPDSVVRLCGDDISLHRPRLGAWHPLLLVVLETVLVTAIGTPHLSRAQRGIARKKLKGLFKDPGPGEIIFDATGGGSTLVAESVRSADPAHPTGFRFILDDNGSRIVAVYGAGDKVVARWRGEVYHRDPGGPEAKLLAINNRPSVDAPELVDLAAKDRGIVGLAVVIWAEPSGWADRAGAYVTYATQNPWSTAWTAVKGLVPKLAGKLVG